MALPVEAAKQEATRYLGCVRADREKKINDKNEEESKVTQFD